MPVQRVPASAADLVSGRPVTLTVEEPGEAHSLMFEGVDCSPGPLFSVSEMGTFFFGRPPQWVRRHEQAGHLTLDGVQVGHRTESGARRYDLADVERGAHALLGAGAIQPAQMRYVIALLRLQGRMWGYLT